MYRRFNQAVERAIDSVLREAVRAKRCPACGAMAHTTKPFCMNCGAPYEPPVKVCPACGDEAQPDKPFCGRCGARLPETSAPGEASAAASPHPACAHCGRVFVTAPDRDRHFEAAHGTVASAAPVKPHVPQTNGLAVASLVVGIISTLMGFAGMGWFGVLAAVHGHRARRQIQKSGEAGAGMAMAGLVLGYVAIVLTVGGVLANLPTESSY